MVVTASHAWSLRCPLLPTVSEGPQITTGLDCGCRWTAAGATWRRRRSTTGATGCASRTRAPRRCAAGSAAGLPHMCLMALLLVCCSLHTADACSSSCAEGCTALSCRWSWAAMSSATASSAPCSIRWVILMATKGAVNKHSHTTPYMATVASSALSARRAHELRL